MNCGDLRELFALYDRCEQTEYGFRIATHCMYPSFDQVAVYVTKYGEGYRVTDGGELARTVFLHGRDEAALSASLKKAGSRHDLEIHDGMLVASVDDKEWLIAAILAVANGASEAAHSAIDQIASKRERELIEQIYVALTKVVSPKRIARQFKYRGSSGRMWPIDLAVVDVAKPLLVRAITPHPNSISSSYTAFGDIAVNNGAGRFAVHDAPLNNEDISLMLQVAELVPIAGVEPGARRVLGLLS